MKEAESFLQSSFTAFDQGSELKTIE